MVKRKRKAKKQTTLKSLINKILKFLVSPKKAFKENSKTTVKNAMIYALVGLFFSAFMSGIIALFIPLVGVPFIGLSAFVLVLVGVLIIGFIGLIVNAMWLHLWAYIFGARKGFSQTMKTIFYANTPNYYLGWIPFINIITSIWTLALVIIGLMQMQKLSINKALAAVVISVIIPLIILVILIVFALKSVAPFVTTSPNVFGL